MSAVVTASLAPEKPRRRADEEKLQREVVTFLKWALPADAEFWHTPNGGLRSKVAAKRLVPMGTKAGIPDLAIVWRGRALFIELKTKTGSLDTAQRQMHKKLSYCGCLVVVCRGVPEVQDWLRSLQMPLQARLT